ncbi:MAG: efflux RND transporter permease subunit [Thermodesulfobacteriota bacterium]|nr:efflux RND transporter permease subunit [Thermodesulfobacteriota bacterium]
MKDRNSMKGPIAWMAGNSVAANLIMLFCLLGGMLMLNIIRQEVFPEIESDIIVVSVAYPGSSPEEIENGIILAVEDVVSGLDGIKNITSAASEGVGSIYIELVEGADRQKLLQDIKNEVDRITTFPDDILTPQIYIASRKRHVISLIISGNTDERTLHELAETSRDILLQDEDITQIDFSGVKDLEISIEVPQKNLRRYNLSIDEISTILKNKSIELPGGGIKTKGGEILLRIKERRDYGREFARTPIITTADGSIIYLEDIAKVKDGYEDSDRFALYNGKPSIRLNIYSVETQTPIQVAQAVKRRIKEINRGLPAGVKLDIQNDRSKIFEQRVNLLLKNGAIGLVLVLFILGLFLEIRLAFWIMMGIPISFIGSFLFLPVMDVSINMITLFAYIIALGIVVDDAIVIGENIYHYRQSEHSLLKASIYGARELAAPVTFSILTNIVTFLPLYFIPGIMGKIFKVIPIIVITVFLISLFESLFVLPAHLSHSRRKDFKGFTNKIHNAQEAFSRYFKQWVDNRFGPFLNFSLKHRYLTFIIALSFLFITLSYALSGRMGFGLFPRTEADFAVVSASLPYGTPIERTTEVAKRIQDGARKTIDEIGSDELLRGIFTDIGSGGSHNISIRVYLADPEIRNKIMSTNEFTKKWRSNVGDIPGIDFIKFQSDFGGPGHGSSVTVELNHRKISTLEKASAELALELQKFPNVKDIDDGFQPGKEQVDFKIKPEAESLGLSAGSIALQIRNSYYGSEVVKQQRGRNELTVRVRLPKEERITEASLENMIIKTPTGREVYLREVVELKRGRAYTIINRRNGRRVVNVTADVVPSERSSEILDSIKSTTLPDLMTKYPGLTYSFEGHQAEIRDSMSALKMGFSIAMIAIFALLAIPFRSYIQPLIVMISIPFGIIGAVIGHLITGYSLSLMSMFGIVALSGVVVNDTLVLVDMANRNIWNQGMTIPEAIYNAAIQRFRPIVLTTLTTFLGLTPMILETSRQAKFMIPMAVSLGFGILFATFITLVLVPSLYLILEDIKKRFKPFISYL